jgi:hypothetical protein
VPGDAVITPRTIVLCHLHYQGFQLLGNSGATQGFALMGAINLLGHQFAIPAQHSVKLGHFRNLFQRPLPQLLAALGPGGAFGVTEVEAPVIWSRKTPFSATGYSMWSRSCSSTDPVTYLTRAGLYSICMTYTNLLFNKQCYRAQDGTPPPPYNDTAQENDANQEGDHALYSTCDTGAPAIFAGDG